jgi:hypothetical protein
MDSRQRRRLIGLASDSDPFRWQQCCTACLAKFRPCPHTAWSPDLTCSGSYCQASRGKDINGGCPAASLRASLASLVAPCFAIKSAHSCWLHAGKHGCIGQNNKPVSAAAVQLTRLLLMSCCCCSGGTCAGHVRIRRCTAACMVAVSTPSCLPPTNHTHTTTPHPHSRRLWEVKVIHALARRRRWPCCESFCRRWLR